MSAGVRVGTTAPAEHKALAAGGRTVWLRKIGVSVVDQALLSLLSLAIGLLFVRLSTKSEYALYAQMTAMVLLVSSASTATINSPLMTLLPQTPEPGRTQLATAALRLLVLMCTAAAALVGALVWLVPSLLAVADPSFGLLAALSAAILAAALREFFRNLFFINLRPLECLRLDVVYVLACAAAIGVFLEFARASAVAVLAISAAAGFFLLLPWIPRAALDSNLPHGSVADARARIRPLAQWSLPTLLVTFVGSGFPLLTTHVIGVDATAEIVAARLFVQPLGPIFVAWSNVFRPQLAHLSAVGQHRRVRRIAVISALAMVVGILGYLALILLAYPALEHYALGPAYRNLESNIAWWGAGSLIAGVAGVGSGVLIAQGDFKQCFWSAFAGNIASVPLLLLFGGAYGKVGVLSALALGNAISALWIFSAVATNLAVEEADRT